MSLKIPLLTLFLTLTINFLTGYEYFDSDKFNFEERMGFFNVPGVSIAVIKDGEIYNSRGIGVYNKSSGLAVNEETLFHAANISKALTALGVLKLVEEGFLDLDTDVNNYLIDWSLGKEIYSKNRKITLRYLLNHTSGIHSSGLRGYPRGERLPSLEEILDGLGNSSKVSVHYFPGLKYRYSWGGYLVIQKVIEDVTGVDFSVYMKSKVLDPLGMSNSYFSSSILDVRDSNISMGYDLFGRVIEGGWRNYPELAAIGLWSTPSDIAKFCLEIQNILTADYEGIVTRETLKKMLVKYKKSWGLGLSIKFDNDDLIIRHSGKSSGFISYFISRPYKKDGFVFMTNSDNAWKLIMEMVHSIDGYESWGL